MKETYKTKDNSYPKLKNVKEQEKLERMLKKSTSKFKIKEKNVKENTKLNKYFFYKRILPVIITFPIAISMLTNTLKEISNDGRVTAAISIVVEEATENLHQAGIIIIEDNGIMKINKNLTEEDYQNIEISNPSVGEAYAYKMVFEKAKANLEEKNNLVLTMSYNNKQRYTDWNEFYEVNELINEEGKPSIKVFNEQSKIELLEAYNNGEINNIIKEINISNINKVKVKVK